MSDPKAIKTKPAGDSGQVGTHIVHRKVVSIMPAQVGILYHIFRFAHRPQHSIGDTGQITAPVIKLARRLFRHGDWLPLLKHGGRVHFKQHAIQR